MTSTINACTVHRASNGEHQLVASRTVEAGEVLLTEPPLLYVPLGRYKLGTYVWDMVDRMLSDPDLLQRLNRCKLLAAPQLLDELDLAVENTLVKKHRKSRQFIRTLYYTVGTNNVGVLNHDRIVVGYGVYPLLSRADHSCVPNTALVPGDWKAGQVNLIAKQTIKAGEPLTWSYFRESEFLPQPYIERNVALVNLYRFVCRCPRCRAERPPEVPASGPKQVEYFDRLLEDEAKRLYAHPDGLKQALAQTPISMHREAFRRSQGR